RPFLSIPALFNQRTYVQFTLEAELRRIMLPLDDAEIQETITNGNWAELHSLPVKVLERQQISANSLYDKLLQESQRGVTATGFATISPGIVVCREREQ